MMMNTKLKIIDAEFLREHRKKLHMLISVLSGNPWDNEEILIKIDHFITKSKEMEKHITDCLSSCLKGGDKKCQ
jgi:hypothetical protein